ncbi:MAG: hypothetical protein IPM96_08405 [Ignavibacteria bacterium]|nr:hypothetical protein [Ignavibacteria bacterium]
MLGFNNGGAETWVPVTLGIATIGISLLTKYKYSLIKLIPMKDHLLFGLLSGIFLAASPWLFGFSDYVYLPHLLFGIIEIGASLTTQTIYHPDRERSKAAAQQVKIWRA